MTKNEMEEKLFIELVAQNGPINALDAATKLSEFYFASRRSKQEAKAEKDKLRIVIRRGNQFEWYRVVPTYMSAEEAIGFLSGFQMAVENLDEDQEKPDIAAYQIPGEESDILEYLNSHYATFDGGMTAEGVVSAVETYLGVSLRTQDGE